MEPWLEQAMTGHNVIAEQAMFLRPKKVTPKEHLMNAALWIVQIVLAALYLMAGGDKLFGPGVGLEATMPGMSLGLIRLIGIIEGLAALGLLLPMVARNRMKIAMWAAVVLASRRMERLKELRAEIEAEGGDAHVVALDVRGRAPASSEALAQWMGSRLESPAPTTFLIGGAIGLDPALVKQAHAALSLSAMTWPHLLARVMLAEQVYRAQTILNRIPYHNT